jgi:type IV pilus assembly protein PilM
MKHTSRKAGWPRQSTRARRFLAVDFDSRELRIVRAGRAGPWAKMRAFCRVAMPKTLDAEDPRAIGAFLRETLQKRKLGRLPIVMNVSRAQAVLKPLRLPPGTDRSEIAGMVQFQVQQDLPFPIDEAVVDFTVEREVVEDDLHGLDILAAAVRQSNVEHYQAIAESAGLKLLRLGLRPYANARCAEACGTWAAGQVTALVQITCDETEITVMEGPHLAFSRSAVVKMPESQADDAPDSAQHAQAVVAEVLRSLQGYTATQEGATIGRLLIAGGTGLEQAVVDQLRRETPTPAERFDPAEALGLKKIDDASAFIAAIGLAGGSRGGQKVPFDFLHPKQPVVQRDPLRQRKLAAALLGGIVLFAAIAGSWHWLDGKSQRLAALRRTKAKHLETEKVVEDLVKRVLDIDTWAEQRVDWLDHWAKLSGVLPGPREVYIDELRTGENSLKFTVRARESKIIEKIVSDLQNAGYTPKTGKDGEDDNPWGYVRHTDVTLFIPTEDKIEIDPAAIKPPPRPKNDDLDIPLGKARKRGGGE